MILYLYLEQYKNAKLSTDDVDEKGIIESLKGLYLASGITKPEAIFCDSPWQLANLIDYAGRLYKVGFENREQFKAEFLKGGKKNPH